MSTGESALPPAGWLEDPDGTGRQRWWDGASWTEHYRSDAAGSGAAPTQADGIWAPMPAGAHALGMTERTWATLAHASAFISLWVGLPFFGPLGVYLWRRDDAPAIRAHAAAAFNFQVSWLLWSIVLVLATASLALLARSPLPVIASAALLFVPWVVLTVLASRGAAQGRAPFRYPLTITFLK